MSAPHAARRTASDASVRIDAVVKLGGGVLHDAAHFTRVHDALHAAAAGRRLLVVPGGGPFADAVRAVDARVGLPSDAAHWMAILAMDQYAHLLVARLPDSVLATTIAEVHDALGKGALPVLAPARWLREADPLPHSWDVTSDSIAAWVAGMLGAPRLVLLKPAGAHGVDAVDRHFAHVLDPGTMHVIVPADRLDTLASALDGHEARR